MNRIMKIKNCYGCGGCVAVCPSGAITLRDEVEIISEKCIKCRRCEFVCPAGLITIEKSTTSP
ncbi:MAG TPA: 4Fe-4S dicluster domain-containing protein [Candidatus Altiarchaeales archaeon]|nr:4Fe-4S dicluster domain-containing protein [Candidatus Altiarchaeales archaeon]